MKKYRVNEVFYSLQGEGVRAGTPNVFVRFSGCNLSCRLETHGFDCDTEFVSGRDLTIEQLLEEIKNVGGDCPWVILTGGEPALQLDQNLLDALHKACYRVAIETNGTISLPKGIDWICVSPKTAEHTLRVLEADEVKYVRSKGQAIPRPFIKSKHCVISPAFTSHGLPQEDLEWCVKLVRENPLWRLSVQQHKLWRVR